MLCFSYLYSFTQIYRGGNTLFTFENVSYFVSDQDKNAKSLLSDINFSIEKGKIYTIMGPSGSGKSTLLNLFNRMIDPTKGRIFFEGKLIKDYPIQYIRRTIGMVLQKPHMFPGTVEENLNYGPRLLGKNLLEPVELLKSVGLDYSLLTATAEKLSGGQQQRVALARVLANEPQVLLLDEVTSALDACSSMVIEQLLFSLSRNQKVTVVMVTHNLEQAKQLADFSLLLEDGRLVSE